MSTFDVAVSREGLYWVAVVDGVRGGATEARTLVNLDIEVRDLLAGLLDVDEDSIALEWDFAPALGELADEAAQLERASADLDQTKAHYESVQRHFVESLNRKGVSTRDSARLAKVSHQRISQLLNA